MQEAAPQLSTLPETWERTSLSDEGIREALRARTKHYAAQDGSHQAGSGSMSPERSVSRVSAPPYRQPLLLPPATRLCLEALFLTVGLTDIPFGVIAMVSHVWLSFLQQCSVAILSSCSDGEPAEGQNGSSPAKQPQRKTKKEAVTPSSTKSSEAVSEEGLSERQKRRRRVGWALHQRRGKPARNNQRDERPRAAHYSRELEAELCSQIQVCHMLLATQTTSCNVPTHCISI